MTIPSLSGKTTPNNIATTTKDGKKMNATDQQVNFNSAPTQLREGETLTFTATTTNIQPGSSVFWTVTGKGTKPHDFGLSQPLQQATVNSDGSLQIKLMRTADLGNKGSKRFSIAVFADKQAQDLIGRSPAIQLVDRTQAADPISKPSELLTLSDQVIPARFSKQKIPIQDLIQVKQTEKIKSFDFRNSNSGGYFIYEGKQYQGTDLLNVPTEKVNTVFYIPTAPKGNYDPAILKSNTIKALVENVRPGNNKGASNSELSNLIVSETQEQRTIRQDPFNPATTLPKAGNPSIRDRISIRINTDAGTSDWLQADWITRGNWKPEISTRIDRFQAQSEPTQIPITDILELHDFDGDSIKTVSIRDLSPGEQTGFFTYKGQSFQGKTLPSLSESDFNNVFYQPGQSGSHDAIEVTAIDSQNASSQPFQTRLTTEQPEQTFIHLPKKHSFKTSDLGNPVPASHLITINPGTALADTEFALNIKNKKRTIGHFEQDGKQLNDHQLSGLNLQELDTLMFIPGESNAKSTITVQSTNAAGHVTSRSTQWQTPKNKKPKLAVDNIRLAATDAGEAINVSSLIKASDDSERIKSYTLKNKDGHGSFNYKGKIYTDKPLNITASELEQVQYIAPESGHKDNIVVSVFDGEKTKTSTAKWQTSGKKVAQSLGRRFNLDLNRTWSIGSFLGIANEKTYSKFLGLDKDISSTSYNPSIGVAGLKFKTGDNKLKAGLDLNAGYGLGSFSISGGLNAEASLDDDGLSFSATTFAPTIDLELPYAYLNLDAVGEVKLSPSLKFWYDVFLASGETSNLLSFLNTNINESKSLIDLDTRTVSGSNYSKTFNIGAFSATAEIPQFNNASQLSSIPLAIRNDSDWSQGYGDGVAYGISGSSTLLNLEMSLGKIASYFGIPVTFNTSIWNGALSASGTLVDASIGIEAGIDYNASVALKPNLYAIVEGSSAKHDILNNTNLSTNQFNDANNDGQISVTIQADPIIAASASASITADVNAEAELLSADVGVNKWGISKNWSVGPLWESGPLPLYSDEIPLVDMSKTIALSDIAPTLQNQLSYSFDLPVA